MSPMKIAKTVTVWIPAVLIALSGLAKLVGNPQIVEGLAKLGVQPYVPLLGAMDVAFAALIVVSATFNSDSCSRRATLRAIATELSHGALSVNPFIPIGLLWTGAFIRDRSIFFEPGHAGRHAQNRHAGD